MFQLISKHFCQTKNSNADSFIAISQENLYAQPELRATTFTLENQI